jgi:hypothetical protein
LENHAFDGGRRGEAFLPLRRNRGRRDALDGRITAKNQNLSFASVTKCLPWPEHRA